MTDQQHLRDSAVTTVSQSLLYTGSESGKILALRDLLSSGGLPYPSLIFVQSITRADELFKTLIMDGMRVDVVHGNRGKGKRDEAVKGFREGRVWMLVVTEVLARGMDFRGVKVVVNYGGSRYLTLETPSHTAKELCSTEADIYPRLSSNGTELYPPNRSDWPSRSTWESNHFLQQ